MAYKKYSENFKSQLVKELEQGATFNEVANKYSINKSTIFSWSQKYSGSKTQINQQNEDITNLKRV